MPIDEALLDAIAGQAQVAYAEAQLAACQVALRLWQQCAEQPASEFSQARIQHELAYYTHQVIRWQHYLARLAPVPQMVCAPAN